MWEQAHLLVVCKEPLATTLDNSCVVAFLEGAVRVYNDTCEVELHTRQAQGTAHGHGQ